RNEIEALLDKLVSHSGAVFNDAALIILPPEARQTETMGLLVPFRKSRMMPPATADQDRWLSEKQNPAYRTALIFKEENTFRMEGVFCFFL
ncbi:MAG: hypothetical protein IJA25_04255, partial [Anaerotignum sp.]|nr:hypothetical protein [Anaerotignum sp.]